MLPLSSALMSLGLIHFANRGAMCCCATKVVVVNYTAATAAAIDAEWMEAESCEVRSGKKREIRERAEREECNKTSKAFWSCWIRPWSRQSQRRRWCDTVQFCIWFHGECPAVLQAWRRGIVVMFCSRCCCSASGILWMQQSGWSRPASRPFRCASCA